MSCVFGGLLYGAERRGKKKDDPDLRSPKEILLAEKEPFSTCKKKDASTDGQKNHLKPQKKAVCEDAMSVFHNNRAKGSVGRERTTLKKGATRPGKGNLLYSGGDRNLTIPGDYQLKGGGGLLFRGKGAAALRGVLPGGLRKGNHSNWDGAMRVTSIRGKGEKKPLPRKGSLGPKGEVLKHSSASIFEGEESVTLGKRGRFGGDRHCAKTLSMGKGNLFFPDERGGVLGDGKGDIILSQQKEGNDHQQSKQVVRCAKGDRKSDIPTTTRTR